MLHHFRNKLLLLGLFHLQKLLQDPSQGLNCSFDRRVILLRFSVIPLQMALEPYKELLERREVLFWQGQ
jgi:hypothetical protein